jgi:hypothetical protein
MNRLIRQGCVAAALALLAAPLVTTAQERQVAPPPPKPQAGLLLPAVQKAQDQPQEQAPAPAEEEGVMPHYHGPTGGQPQQGIEPDEIDAAARNRAATAPAPTTRGRIDKASPMLMKSSSSGLSTQEMMAKLQPSAYRPSSHRRITPITIGKQEGGSTGPTSVQAKPAEPPKYEIADCGTQASPMICCHHEAGDGSSCNLFKILCENAGGTAQGDGESAACSDW